MLLVVVAATTVGALPTLAAVLDVAGSSNEVK